MDSNKRINEKDQIEPIASNDEIESSTADDEIGLLVKDENKELIVAEQNNELTVNDDQKKQRWVNSSPYNFFIKRDPTDGRGILLENCGISICYSVDSDYREKLESIKDELTSEVISTINEGTIGNIKPCLVEYQDIKYSNKEGIRRCIEIEYETVRGTLITTFVRFYTLGDNIYVGLDSYILGPLNWLSFIFRSLISFAILLSLPVLLAFSFFISLFPLIAVSAYLFMEWNSVIRNLSSGLNIALRQKFRKPLSSSSFDTDDTVMFLKSSTPAILKSIQKVFKNHKLKIADILEQEINRIEQQIINIDNRGGSMKDLAVGIGNKIFKGGR